MVIKMGFRHLNTIVLLVMASTVFAQFLNRKPWPTYSLQNMPRTSFSCRDKILGGYYADAETQCQMFHVCVKVAGVGVQDFRFLCPNGTAFDQEAQICADWGDVDCEQATLYYSSDNFDLYRIGSGFENKRAPLAEEEEEATFHLQRAETSDARRSKQTIVNQNSRPEQPPIYRQNTERNFVQQQSSNNQFPYQARKQKESTNQNIITTKKPFYQKPTENQFISSVRNNNNNQGDSKNDDELLKGSHSSNFFNNRNNGKEEDLIDFTKSPLNTKRPLANRGRQRARNPSRQNYNANRNNIPTPPSKTTTTFDYQEPRVIEQQKPKITIKNNDAKTLTLQTSFRTAELHQYDTQSQYVRNTTLAPLTTVTTTARYSLTPTKPQTQQNIQPTTYNPYRAKSSITTNYDDYRTPRPNSFINTQTQTNPNPFYNVQYEKAAEINPDQFNRFSNRKDEGFYSNKSNDEFNNDGLNKFQTTTQNYNNFVQKNNFVKSDSNVHSLGEGKQNTKSLSLRNDDQFLHQTSPRVSNTQLYDNNYQVPLTVRPLEARRVNAALTNQTNQNVIQAPTQEQYYEPQTIQRTFPTPFSKATTNTNTFQQQLFSNSSPVPRGFSYDTTRASSSPSIASTQQSNNSRYQKISRNNENYTPSSSTKKFSTLVPKDQYYPTTFKPTTYKKQTNIFNQKNEKPSNYNFSAASYLPTTPTTTNIPRQTNSDEDDGQYHPELYEKNFPRHKLHGKKKQHITGSQSTRNHQTPAPIDLGDEEEFLKPAHSLNIAVGANQLRAEKAKQSSLNMSSKTSKAIKATQQRAMTSPIPASKKPKKAKKDEDTSYDYAYYDTGSENPHDYSEYDIISEFGKTKKH